MSGTTSRRSFLKGSVAAAAAATLYAPYILRAAPVNKQKLRIAFVGVAGQAGAHIGLAKDEICPCFADVDQNVWQKRNNGKDPGILEYAPNAKGYTDWREMFDKHEKEIDAVVVTTPDHTHAYASMRAIKAGKGCYTEKPLTWSIAEARALADATKDKKVPTQMGNMGHANEENRLTVEYVQAGVIGDITEIHSWTGRPSWPQGYGARPTAKEPPAGVNWDVWLGPAPARKFHDGLHPFQWRGWFDFGCGAVGDMGCHTWDAPFWAMNPDYPSEVELVAIEGKGEESFPKRSHFKWTFPAKGKRPAYEAHWYSGGMMPKTPEEYGKGNMPGSGSFYVGTKGKMVAFGDYGGVPRFIPADKDKALTRPPKTILRSIGHKAEWLEACRGNKPWDFPASNFLYGGALTEVLLLGAMSERLGQVGVKIECDAEKREVKTAAAKALVSREPRKGFSL